MFRPHYRVYYAGRSRRPALPTLHNCHQAEHRAMSKYICQSRFYSKRIFCTTQD